MNLRFFHIPAMYPEQAQDALNLFCSQHRVAQLEKRFVEDGSNSFWSVCVTYVDSQAPLAVTQKTRIDYKEVLNAEDFVVYSKLRELRKQISERDGVPLYNIFNNEQLASLVTNRIASKAQMKNINGIGSKRIEKYGQIFLDSIGQLTSGSQDETVQNSSS